MLTVRTSENTVITSFRLISERQDFSSVRTGENTVRARARIQAFSPVSEEIEKLSSFDLFVSDFSVSGDKMNLHYFFGKVHARKTRVLCMIVHEELL